MLQEIYHIRFHKESAAICKLYEIKVWVLAQHLRPQQGQHSLLSQQLNKGPRQNNKKNIRTDVIKIQERTGITNKDNSWEEMTATTVDQTALATMDTAVLP